MPLTVKTGAMKVKDPSTGNYVDVDMSLGTDYAPINSPALTGTPTAPTAGASTNTTQVATTAFVKSVTGTDALTTTAQTLTGAINELDAAVDAKTSANIVEVSGTEPEDEDNKIWLPLEINEGVQVPSWGEHQELAGIIGDTSMGTTATTVKGAVAELKGAVNAISLSKGITSVSDLPIGKNCFVTFVNDVTIGGVTIPAYSKGVLATAGGADNTLYAISVNGKLFTAYKNGDNWVSGRCLTAETDVLEKNSIVPGWELGTLSGTNGSESTATTQIRTNFLRCKAGTAISCASGYQFNVFMYNIKDGSFEGYSNWQTTQYAIPNDYNIRILARTEGSSVISTISDVSSKIYIGINEIEQSFFVGSDSNGNYIKYGDGTLIQYGTKLPTVDISNTWGALYYGTAPSMNFPLAFIARPVVNITISGTQSAMVMSCSASTTGISNLQFCRGTTTNAQIVYDWVAIGRWK